MKDYLDVEYDFKSHPKSNYPFRLSNYLSREFGLLPGQDLLEIGSGRAEVLAGFARQGINCHAIDSAPSARGYAEECGAQFETFQISTKNLVNPFGGKKFDIVFSKSLIEHIEDPLHFLSSIRNILKPGGKVVTLTPDFESNYKIFYDDITHIKPFTSVSLKQSLELTSFVDIKVFKFRQLPSTWDSSFFRFLSICTGLVTHHRVKNKWCRWSRELMIASIGINHSELENREEASN
jgi:2-polyprenyl-3-methyl-5-hydroxy-6-metoxy-1,4-benzoquinol methylase